MDNRYLNGKIYKITSSQTDKIYIGSTIQTLVRRLQGHKDDVRRGHNPSSKALLQYEDAKIELIENYPCKSKKELETRERYYIEITPNRINKCIPTRTQKEWDKENPEKRKLISKKYSENNRELLRLKTEIYRENNPEKVKLSVNKYYENNKETINKKNKIYRENNVEKEKLRNKKYREKNKDKLKAIRDFQNTWCGNYNYNGHNNLLYIDLDIFK